MMQSRRTPRRHQTPAGPPTCCNHRPRRKSHGYSACAAGTLISRARPVFSSKAPGQDNGRCVFFVNAHCVNVAARDPSYARLLAASPFVFADGVGMAIAARLAGHSTCEQRQRHRSCFPNFAKPRQTRACPLPCSVPRRVSRQSARRRCAGNSRGCVSPGCSTGTSGRKRKRVRLRSSIVPARDCCWSPRAFRDRSCGSHATQVALPHLSCWGSAHCSIFTPARYVERRIAA